MRISTFANKYDTQPEADEFEFSELPEVLRAMAESDKETAALWSPTEMDGGKTAGHTKRVTALALDFDHGEPPWAALAGWTYFAHTTHSHTPDEPRWRVVLELDKPCSAEEWKTRFKAKCAMHQWPADPACCNANRCFYVPPPDAEWRTNDGRSVELPAFEKAELSIQEDKAPDGLETDGSAFWPEVEKLVRQLPPCVSGKGGDTQLFETACMLRSGFRLTPEACLRALRIYNERCDPPWDESRLVYKIEQAAHDTQHERGGLIPKQVKEQLVRESPDGWVVELHAALARYLRPTGEIKPMKWDAIMAPVPPVDWLCRDLGIAPGRPTIISGLSGSGKTLAAQELALSVAAGSGLFRCKKGAVLHVDIDQGSEATRRRYQMLVGKRADLDLELIAFSFSLTTTVDGAVQIDNDALFQLAVLADGKRLVIIDSLRGLARGLEENSSAFGDVLAALAAVSNALAEVRGCTPPVFLLIHHSGKPAANGRQNGLRGSSAIRDRAGCVWVLERPEGESQTIWHQDKISESTVKSAKAFATKIEEGPLDGNGEPTWINILKVEGTAGPTVERANSNVRRLMAVILAKADGRSQWFTRDELIQGGKTKDAAAALSELVAAKRLNTKTEKSRTFYSAVLTDPKS